MIIASCGHEITLEYYQSDEGFVYHLDDRAINYSLLCPGCKSTAKIVANPETININKEHLEDVSWEIVRFANKYGQKAALLKYSEHKGLINNLIFK